MQSFKIAFILSDMLSVPLIIIYHKNEPCYFMDFFCNSASSYTLLSSPY